jgi:hypothetical protein
VLRQIKLCGCVLARNDLEPSIAVAVIHSRAAVARQPPKTFQPRLRGGFLLSAAQRTPRGCTQVCNLNRGSLRGLLEVQGQYASTTRCFKERSGSLRVGQQTYWRQ